MTPRAKFSYPGISGKESKKEDKFFTQVDDWLKEKRANDGAEGLWRIHDGLYDLNIWMNSHPGGKSWIEMTKGTDITEAFECNHLSEKAEKMLPRFFVKKAKTQRNSLITFHEKGFFRTLKRKIIDRNLLDSTCTKPQTKTKLLADSLFASVFITGLLGTVWDCWLQYVSGVLLCFLTICAHNFFHLGDNWRMYYFNLSLMSLREWRISHVLSHHLYPNTKLDLEVTMMEPLLKFLPTADKKFGLLSCALSPFVMIFLAHFQFLRRTLKVLFGKENKYEIEELIGFSFPLFLFTFSGQGIWKSFVAWNVIIASASFAFGFIGLTAAHHHPDIYHDGDFLGNNRDFGILQLAAVRNRMDVDGNFFLTLILFGEHTLHHLFPAIDHSKLHILNSVLEETCREFKINFKSWKSKHLIVGMFQQLTRNYTNTDLKIMKK